MSYRVSKTRAFGGETAVSILLIVQRDTCPHIDLHKNILNDPVAFNPLK